MNPKSISGVLITHEHLDHYKGADVFCKSYDIPLYLNYSTYSVIKHKVSGVRNVNIIENTEFSIGGLDIKTFKLPHDASEPIGYSVIYKGKKISVATDMGYVSDEIFNNLKDSNVILIESNYNEELVKMSPYPYFLKDRILSSFGHLSNEDCSNAIVELIKNFPKKIVLGHLSCTNNFPELAYQTAKNILSDNNVELGRDVELTVAHRNLPSNYMRI